MYIVHTFRDQPDRANSDRTYAKLWTDFGGERTKLEFLTGSYKNVSNSLFWNLKRTYQYVLWNTAVQQSE